MDCVRCCLPEESAPRGVINTLPRGLPGGAAGPVCHAREAPLRPVWEEKEARVWRETDRQTDRQTDREGERERGRERESE